MRLAEAIQNAKDLCSTDRNFLQLIRFSRSTESDHNRYICFAGNNGDSAYVVQLENVDKLSERIINHFPWMPTTEELTAKDWVFTRSCCRIARGFVANIEIIRPPQAQGMSLAQVSILTYNELKRECETFARQWQETEDPRLIDATQQSIKHLALKLVFGNRFDELFK